MSPAISATAGLLVYHGQTSREQRPTIVPHPPATDGMDGGHQTGSGK